MPPSVPLYKLVSDRPRAHPRVPAVHGTRLYLCFDDVERVSDEPGQRAANPACEGRGRVCMGLTRDDGTITLADPPRRDSTVRLPQ